LEQKEDEKEKERERKKEKGQYIATRESKLIPIDHAMERSHAKVGSNPAIAQHNLVAAEPVADSSSERQTDMNAQVLRTQ
jgi:hypothetical protein